MKARTHDLAAVTALGVVVISQPNRTVSLGTLLVALLANQLGGIAPDIDQPTAPFWRNLPIGGLFGRVISRMLGGHRFLSHSILGVVLFGFLSKLLLVVLQPIMPSIDIELVWLAFIIGFLSHLLMDTFTKEGVPWLLPLPIKVGLPPVKALRVTTGTLSEGVVFGLILLFDVWYCSTHYHDMLNLLHYHIT